MKILSFFKYVLLFGAVGFLIQYHISPSNDQEEAENTTTTTNYKEVLSAAYTAYYPSHIKAVKEKTVEYAEKLYQKDLAEGKIQDEFKGLTVLSYSIKAIDAKEYKEEFSPTDRLTLVLPILVAILVIIAIVISINLGLGTIRRLDFDNDATTFNNQK